MTSAAELPPGDDGEAGLFGPGSVTWRLHAEPVGGVAGLRAILLQALNPLAMAGVDQHSRFRDDPWGRLTTTATYVQTTTFGTIAQAAAMGERVRHVHQFINGTDPVTGLPYDATDSDLLLWVHCCLVDSFSAVARRAGARVSDEDVDRYLVEQVRAAELVGIRAADVPTTRGDLDDYFAAQRPHLRVSQAARDAVAQVLVPALPLRVLLTTPARPLWAGVAGLALLSLPGWARRLYALPRPAGLTTLTDATATAALRALRSGAAGAQLAVPRLREPPLLVEARARLAAAAARG